MDPLITLAYTIIGAATAWAFRDKLQLSTYPQGIRDHTRHTYIRGVIGSGKSWLMYNLFLQRTVNHGGLFVSTHGLKDLLRYIPEQEVARTLLIQPGNARSRGINFFQRIQRDSGERLLIADQLIDLLKKLSARAWGDNIQDLVYAGALAVLEAQEKSQEFSEATIYDVYRLLMDAPYRSLALQYVESPTVHDTFATTNPNTWDACIRRMRQLLRNEYLMSTLAHPEPIDLAQEVRNKSIIICDFDSAEIGPITSEFLAQVIMSKFYLIATTRSIRDSAFYCFYDEFQTYSNEYICKYIEEGRKRAMPILLAHQRAGQLTKSTQEAVALCATWYIFQVTMDDARHLARSFPEKEYPWQRFVNLPLFTVIFREAHGRTTRYGVRQTKPLPPPSNFHREIVRLNHTGPTHSEIIQRVTEKGGVLCEIGDEQF